MHAAGSTATSSGESGEMEELELWDVMFSVVYFMARDSIPPPAIPNHKVGLGFRGHGTS